MCISCLPLYVCSYYFILLSSWWCLGCWWSSPPFHGFHFIFYFPNNDVSQLFLKISNIVCMHFVLLFFLLDYMIFSVFLTMMFTISCIPLCLKIFQWWCFWRSSTLHLWILFCFCFSSWYYFPIASHYHVNAIIWFPCSIVLESLVNRLMCKGGMNVFIYVCQNDGFEIQRFKHGWWCENECKIKWGILGFTNFLAMYNMVKQVYVPCTFSALLLLSPNFCFVLHF